MFLKLEWKLLWGIKKGNTNDGNLLKLLKF